MSLPELEEQAVEDVWAVVKRLPIMTVKVELGRQREGQSRGNHSESWRRGHHLHEKSQQAGQGGGEGACPQVPEAHG